MYIEDTRHKMGQITTAALSDYFYKGWASAFIEIK